MPTLLAGKSAKATPLLATVVAAFDWLHIGSMLATASGRLLFANEAATQILESADGITVDGRGRLILCTGDSQANQAPVGDFQGVLAAALRRGGKMVSIARSSGKPSFVLTLRPTRSEGSAPPHADTAAVLALIHDPERGNANLEGLRELYGLTSTETRIALSMMEGKSTDECATSLGIRRTTVKMHLRNLYGKMGVQRQSELVALMFTSFGNIGCSPNPRPTHGKSIQSVGQVVAC
jgi:DNA-binding CsgD family transcriptional regulator